MRPTRHLAMLSALALAAALALACSSNNNNSNKNNTAGTVTQAATQAAATSATSAATKAPGSPTSSSAGTPAGSPAAGSVPMCPPGGSANALTGAGSTFDNPLFSKLFDVYNQQCKVQVNYQSIGSGGSRAFVYRNGTMLDLNALVPPGSPQLIYANDIDDRGQIVGQAFDSTTGQLVAFVATPR